MLAIKFEFAANRYHATQLGTHFNEGAPELPPSPWRILKAIATTWRRTLPEIPSARVVPIIEALASEYPKFHLPAASTGHNRRYVQYTEVTRERTRLIIDSFVAVRPGTTEGGAGATVVRFAMDGNALPKAFDTLRWGDLARRSAMAQYGRRNEGATSEMLSGKDARGKPLKGHRHAFYLPTDEDGDGQLDHLTIWTPGGLSDEEFRAIVSVDALNSRDARRPVSLSYLEHGQAGTFRGALSLFRESRHWRSLTPYVLPRHVKFRGLRDENGRRRMAHGPEEQIRRELSLRHPNAPGLRNVKIADSKERILPMRSGISGGFRPREFFRYRRGGGSRGGGAFNFALEFEAPVSGPIALGFGCHYGLGLFIPADY